jgi:hypothetical protein
VDAINVSRTLLDWRAQWYEAGWNGRFDGQVSGRLADMAEVEALARERVPVNLGQRVQRITAALDELDHQIDTIILHDREAELPTVWRALFGKLAAGAPAPPVTLEEAPGVTPIPGAAPGTDLHRVQSALSALVGADDGEPRQRDTLAGDGTLMLVRAVSRDISAQALAEYFLKNGGATESVVIAERDGIIVDNAFERVGLPRCGFQHYTPFRAVTQVLKLCLALLWEPVNPHLLLQFLLHPVGPLPRRVRGRLAEAVAGQPGIGGEAWQQALNQIAARQRAFGDNDEAVARTQDTVKSWFEAPRHPTSGAPLTALIAQAQRAASWLARRLNTASAYGEQRLYATALGQAEALIAGLDRLQHQGHLSLGKIELDRLLDEVTGDAPDPDTYAEAGHVRAATHPAAVTGTWHTVAWWDLKPQPFNPRYPWHARELSELAANGVALMPVSERLNHRVQHWLRPVLNAGERVILVVHETDEGHHPLLNQLHALFEGFAQVHVDETLLKGDGDGIPALELPTEPLALKPLPPPRRWWRLPADCALEPRAVESYSSLHKLIDYPHEWVLKYPARIRPGRAADVTDENLLYGNLAHSLFERFFRTHPNWADLDEAALAAWANTALPILIETEGAVLLEPGRGVDRERVTTTIRSAFLTLVKHLHHANIVTVRAEHTDQAPFEHIAIGGTIDLLLTDAKGREIVLDVKWGGDRYRADELAANRHLQLATYAYLRRGRSGQSGWPHQAFFIVQSGNLIAQDASVFPDAEVAAPQDAAGVADLWQRLERTIEWRWQQLSHSEIEVNVAATEPTERSTPPEDALTITDKPDGFDDYTLLTGWEDSA